jgi:hypothetical protein
MIERASRGLVTPCRLFRSCQRLFIRDAGGALDLNDWRIHIDGDIPIPVEVRVQLRPPVKGRVAARMLDDDGPIASADPDECGPQLFRLEGIPRGDEIGILIGEALPPGAKGRCHDRGWIVANGGPPQSDEIALKRVTTIGFF